VVKAPAVKVPAVTTRCSGLNALQRAQRAAAGSTRCSGLNALQLVAAINYGAAVNPCGGGPSLRRRRRSINAVNGGDIRAAAVNQFVSGESMCQ